MTEERKQQNNQGEIEARLAGVRRRENLAKLLKGGGTALFVYAVLLLAALATETLFRFDVAGRTILFWSVNAIGVGIAAWKILPHLLVLTGILQGETDFDTARWLGSKFPLRDHLLNALQLIKDTGNTSNYSPEFIAAAFAEAEKEFDEVDLRRATDFTPGKKAAGLAAGSVLLLLLLPVIFPSPFLGSLERLWNYGAAYAEPPRFRLLLAPGNAEVVKGESVRVTVRAEGEPDQPVKLFARPEGQVTYDELSLQRQHDGSQLHELGSLNTNTEYYAGAGDVRTEQYRITVVDRPLVRMLRVTVSPPRYSGLAQQVLDDHVGDVTGLKGTNIRINVESSKELVSSKLVFGNGTEKEMKISGSKADADLRLTENATYHILLEDEKGLTNKDPVEYSITMVPDAFPKAFIETPGANLDIAGNEQLGMVFRISDDYGLSRLRLAYRLVQSRYEPPAADDSYIDVPLPAGRSTDEIVPFTWPLESLNLVPEDALSYHIEVYDNDNVSGPKIGRSESFLLRLPSLEEVLAGVDEKHESSLETLRDALNDTREARKEMEQLQQEIRQKQQQPDWQEQKKTEDLLDRYKDVQSRLDDARQTIDDMVKEMQKNTLLSKETLEKYVELQKMMDELNSPEFAEAMKRLQEAMRQMSPEEMMKAMENFSLTEEQFRQSIERTMNLLKRIRIEQKVDEAIRRLEEMTKEQEELRRQTNEMKPDESGKVSETAQRQKELAAQADELRKSLDELRSMMQDFPSEMPLDELEQATAQLDSAALADLMEQISEQMKNMQMNAAQSGQQQAMMSMQDLMKQMKMMRDSMLQNQQQQLVNELRKIYQDLLDLSRREEEMKNRTGGLDRTSPLFREEASDQMNAMTDLGRVADRLSAVAQKTFGVTPEMGKSVGDAMNRMRDAMNSLEGRNGNAASGDQEGAMAALNQAAQHVQDGMNSMMQGGGQGMGMSALLQRMQNLTSMQQGINNGTQNLGGMTQQQAAEMGRLAGQQGMVRKSMEELAREAAHTGEMSKLLGDLNDIAREMREVQTDLAQGNIQPETLEKQERILSRMLDSQRSMTERDFEKRRRSEAGREHTRENPPPVDLTTEEGRAQLRRDLLRAMEEGYSKDYQDLIKSYFELLENAEKPEHP